jgi:hypothetical protein
MIILLNGAFVLSQMMAGGGGHFTGGFPLKLHGEFVFRGFRKCNAGVAVQGALYRDLAGFEMGLATIFWFPLFSKYSYIIQTVPSNIF